MSIHKRFPKFWQEHLPAFPMVKDDDDVYVEVPDFTNNNYIAKLNKDSFCMHLGRKDICMVMYYKPDTEDSVMAALSLRAAALNTRRHSSSYAVVNCKYEHELCDAVNFTELPIFMLYSRGHQVGALRDFKSVNSDLLIGYVEKAPVFTASPKSNIRKPVPWL